MFTMRHDKRVVFVPAIITMVFMHLSSVALGTVFPLLFDQKVIIYFSVVLFLFFGVAMLYDAYNLEEKSATEKLQELEEELQKEKENPELTEKLVDSKELKEVTVKKPEDQVPIPSDKPKSPAKSSLEDKNSPKKPTEEEGFFTSIAKSAGFQLMLLLFVGECGDRTQIAAIVLTATHNAWGVAIGGSFVF